MKRLITFICLIVVILLGYQLVTKGFENDSIDIASYEKIEKKSEALTKKLASYDKKNQEEYETALTTLNSSIKMFKDSKAKYEDIYEELADMLKDDESETGEQETIEEIIYSDKEKYNVDFLFVTFGNYAEKEGVDVNYKLTTSSTTDPNSATLNYFLADLKVTVTGQYIDVSNFISDLENDEKLGWEIKDFQMAQGNANGYSGVSATFTIKDVPIDSESYIESSAPTVDENSTGDGTETTDPNAVPTDNTTNTITDGNVVSNTIDNTANTNTTMTNTVSNNTVN